MGHVENSQKATYSVAWTSKSLEKTGWKVIIDKCAVARGLMDKDDMKNLGFADLEKDREGSAKWRQ
jgi:hypothetical protein